MKTYINGKNYTGNELFKQSYTSLRYIRGCPLSGSTTLAIVNDVIYATPFFNKDIHTITSIGVHVSTISGGSSIRLGIYNDNGSIYPGTLLLDAGTINSSASVGVKTIAINYPLGENTLYWLALVSDGTPALYSQHNESVWSIIGFDNTTFNIECPGMYGYAFAYAALPTIYTAGATNYTGAYNICVS